jgi:hypothetical protein
LALGDGVSSDQLWFSQAGNDLIINVVGTEDQITVKSWYAGASSQLDEVVVGSEVLYANQVDQLVSAMAGFSAPPLGETVLSDELSQALQPVLAAAWQTA